MNHVEIIRNDNIISIDVKEGPVVLTEKDFDCFIDAATDILTHVRDKAIIVPSMAITHQETEKAKYTRAWQEKAEQQSQCAKPFARYISTQFDKKARLLDIGCGDGTTVKMLQDQGFFCYGVDITLAGLRKDVDQSWFYTAAAWDMPWMTDFFDYTFSTDMLEHLPPDMVIPTIKEIYRITQRRTLHVIATFLDNRLGYQFHLSVNDIKWWQDQFTLLKTPKVNFTVIDRNNFLKTKY